MLRDTRRGSHGGIMLTPGTTHIVRGTEVADNASFGYERPNDKAFFTAPEIGGDDPNAEQAGWNYAQGKAMMHQMRSSSEGVRPRPVVHMVQPEGKVEADPNDIPWHGQMTADRLKITDTQWTPPPEPGDVGVQGTLPYVNWNQFGPRMNVTDPDRNFLRLKRSPPPEAPRAPAYEDDIG